MTYSGSGKGAAFITGGAIRIGREIALALARKGYNIVIHYNKSEAEARQTKSDVEALGRICGLIRADLNDSKQYAMLIEKVFTLFPNCNVLVNNASIFERSSFLETTEDLFDRHMDINFKAPFFLSQAFHKCCRKGQIINIVDSYVTKNTSSFFSYLLSKKTLNNFTPMAARAMAPNIRVNSIAVGTTDITRNSSEEDLVRKRHALPMKDTVKLEYITRTVIDVVENDFMTGQCIFIDGGESLL